MRQLGTKILKKKRNSRTRRYKGILLNLPAILSRFIYYPDFPPEFPLRAEQPSFETLLYFSFDFYFIFLPFPQFSPLSAPNKLRRTRFSLNIKSIPFSSYSLLKLVFFLNFFDPLRPRNILFFYNYIYHNRCYWTTLLYRIIKFEIRVSHTFGTFSPKDFF